MPPAAGVKEGSIKHSPSTAELLAHLEARMPVQAATLRRWGNLTCLCADFLHPGKRP